MGVESRVEDEWDEEEEEEVICLLIENEKFNEISSLKSGLNSRKRQTRQRHPTPLETFPRESLSMSLDALRNKKGPTPVRTSAGEKKSSGGPTLRSTPKGSASKPSERFEQLKKFRRQPGSGTPGGGGGSSSSGAGGRGARANVSRVVKPAEIHFIGELTGCSGFGDGVSCRWTLDYGESWSLTSKKPEDTKDSDKGDDDDDDDADDAAAAAAASARSKKGLGDKLTEQTHYAYGNAFGEPVWVSFFFFFIQLMIVPIVY